MNHQEQPTMPVRFPDGTRQVPYSIQTFDVWTLNGTPPQKVPEEIPGYRYVRTAEGEWIALKE